MGNEIQHEEGYGFFILSSSFATQDVVSKFEGSDPTIWKDKCVDYFRIFKIPECMWVTSASLHMEGIAAKWLQVYKRQHGLKDWDTFTNAVNVKFRANDYRNAVSDLLELKQEGTVEEYTTAFESLRYQVDMHNLGYDELLFVSQFVKGLKEEIRGAVQGQVPETVDRASLLTRMQQQVLLRAKPTNSKSSSFSKQPSPAPKSDTKVPTGNTLLWKERQLREYRKANGLCYYCGDKYEPGHAEKCPERTKPQINALALNSLDVILDDEVLISWQWKMLYQLIFVSYL